MMVSWKKLECEVCKKSLPKKMQIGDKVVDLVNLARPEGSYIILESTSKATKTDEKSLYILQFKDHDMLKLVTQSFTILLIFKREEAINVKLESPIFLFLVFIHISNTTV